MPNKTVSRAEFATVLSRILWWNKYESSDESVWYVNHLNALKESWIITNTDHTLIEYRWNVILMIYRSAKNHWLISSD